MGERLIIKNFAGIREITLDLRDINVLIGPQASGKSICAKSLYYFKSFLFDLFETIENGQNKREFDAAFLEKFKKYFPLESLGEQDFLVRYELNDHFIQVERITNKPKLSYSEYYKRQLSIWRRNITRILEREEDEQLVVGNVLAINDMRRRFLREQAAELGDIARRTQLFIPAGRSFFAFLRSNIFSFLSSNNAIDPFLAEFGAFYERVKQLAPDRVRIEKALRSQVDSLVEDVLNGKYVREGGQDYLELVDGRRTSLINASSGQQESLPLALILSRVPFRSSSGYTIYIEEPEAHLFPTAQRKIVELIATIYHMSPRPIQFVITTHSPYILTAFNNLIHAGNLAEQLDADDQVQLTQIVPQAQMLRSEDISVYSLHDGLSETILSEETGLITTNLLDQVSDDLAIQFEQLLNLE